MVVDAGSRPIGVMRVEAQALGGRGYRQVRGSARRSPQRRIVSGDLRIVVCDLVFIGLLLTLCYFAIGGLEMQGKCGDSGQFCWSFLGVVAARRRANLSFRLRLHSGVSTPASKLARDPGRRQSGAGLRPGCLWPE